MNHGVKLIIFPVNDMAQAGIQLDSCSAFN